MLTTKLSIKEDTMAVPMRSAEARRTETPNATMTTLASPSAGGSISLSLWQVEMRAEQRGPVHVFDREQLWTVRAGTVSIIVDGTDHVLGAGDALVIPAGSVRQVRAIADAELLACGHADAQASVPGEGVSRGTPPWIS
jgi:quercetin dioxygenase-like cupin family protein